MRELNVADAFAMIKQQFPDLAAGDKKRLMHAALGFDFAYLKESFGFAERFPESVIDAERDLIVAVANVNGLTKDERSELGAILFMTLQVPQRMREIATMHAAAFAQTAEDQEEDQGQTR